MVPASSLVADGDHVSDRIAGCHQQQVVGVVGHEALGADRVGVERIPDSGREEEMLAGIAQFLRRVSVLSGEKKTRPEGTHQVGSPSLWT